MTQFEKHFIKLFKKNLDPDSLALLFLRKQHRRITLTDDVIICKLDKELKKFNLKTGIITTV